MDTGKRSRAYDSRGRQAQARRNRDAILDIARAGFLARGYAATTMASIAGEGPVTAPQRSDHMQVAEHDPHTIVRHWGTLSTEVAPLVAPVHLLIRDAAATDPEMAALLRDSDRQRRERMRHNARTLADRGHLKPGITLEDATDVMWTYSSPELYELLVIRCGWNLARYGRFLAESMAAALLPEA